MRFGDKLQQERTKRGMTHEDMARAMGFKTGSGYNQYETTNRLPKIDNFMLMCKALKMSPNELLKDVDLTKKPKK